MAKIDSYYIILTMVSVSFNISDLRERKKNALENGQYLVDWVEDELRRQMTKLARSRNAKLPQEQVLAKSFDVSLNTIRSAMSRLKKERLVQSVQGKGTFVVPVVKKQTKTVLIFGADPHHPYEAMAIGTISSVLQQRGCVSSVEFYSPLPPEEEWENLLDHHENLFGIIVVGKHVNNKKFLHFLAEGQKIPVVYIGDDNEPIRKPAICNNVSSDFRLWGYVAVDHLIRMGHQNIMMALFRPDSAWEKETIQGCEIALRGHGLDFREDWVLDLHSLPLIPSPVMLAGLAGETSLEHPAFMEDARRASREDARKKIEEIFQSPNPPTALIHNLSCELQLRDVVHHCFHDRFAPSDIVGLLYEEYIRSRYTGYHDEVILVAARFRCLAERAVDILFRNRETNSTPVRETLEDLHLYRRHDGAWGELEIIKT